MPKILPSKSPRRKELLSLITDDFTVDSAEVDETLPCDIEPDKAVEYLSKIKAQPFRKSGKIVIGDFDAKIIIIKYLFDKALSYI